MAAIIWILHCVAIWLLELLAVNGTAPLLSRRNRIKCLLIGFAARTSNCTCLLGYKQQQQLHDTQRYMSAQLKTAGPKIDILTSQCRVTVQKSSKCESFTRHYQATCIQIQTYEKAWNNVYLNILRGEKRQESWDVNTQNNLQQMHCFLRFE